MARSEHVVPFIKKSEGGLSRSTADTASAHPIPDGSGYHTNKGITWTAWSKLFGSGPDSIAKFYVMSDQDWNKIFKPLYWDAVMGDKITSQKIADLIVDWVWGSGKHYPELDVQIILNHLFNEHLTEDGNFGPATIAAINREDETELFKDIVTKRYEFLQNIVTNNPKQEINLQGWKNRMAHLITFETTGQLW